MLFAIALLMASQTAKFNFQDSPGAKTFASDGAEVTVQPVQESPDITGALISVRITGYQTIIVDGGSAQPWVSRSVAIGKLSKTDRAPSVIIQSYTGGAHCCAAVTVVVPDAGKLKTVELGAFDGDVVEAFPEDLDGDGIVDFEFQDQAFLYAFSSYATSFAPPKFINIYRGKAVDVSDQPGFRSHFASHAAGARKLCQDKANPDRNGACAGYVASSARFGNFDAAMLEAEKWAYAGSDQSLPEGCRVEVTAANNYACPADQKIVHRSFSNALRWFLDENGYL